MNTVKIFRICNFHKDFSCKREYDCPVKYANKSFDQFFVDYLERTYFNSKKKKSL